jgi:MFS family permease
MADILVQTNLFAIVGWLLFIAWALLGFFLGVVMKMIVRLMRRFTRTECREYNSYENGYYFWSAWAWSHFWFGIVGALILDDLYTISYQSDSAVYIFTTLVLYLVFLYGWLVWTYVLRFWKGFAYTSAVFSLIFGAITIVLIFVTIPDNPWYHYLSILLLKSPICAILATYYAFHYRSVYEIDQLISSSSSSVITNQQQKFKTNYPNQFMNQNPHAS